ncbi:MAG: bifunctional heptose 7-phosphate kinase/heptose 1-phosphate adenyltransferase [Deltaproteobacteria bacterium]|nr:bifunctional heptose 7-phosphate kinase/heptose 1-phosphate adenyltransferase [Deltaproteobacteria bacterium]
MRDELTKIIDRFGTLRVVVLGDAILDRYITGDTTRLCREAPVPVMEVERCGDFAGGAANTAVNLATLGADVCFVSLIGDDQSGRALDQCLRRAGVERRLIRDPQRATVTKTRMICGKQMLLRMDQGSTMLPRGNIDRRLCAAAAKEALDCDILLISDYGCGAISERTIGRLEQLRSRTSATFAVDSRRRLMDFAKLRPDLAKPNYEEALFALGREKPPGPGRPEFIEGNGHLLQSITNAKVVAVTLDSDGALILATGCTAYRTYTRPVQNSQAAGAGDTFVSAMALALHAGASIHAAAEIASSAAAVVVERRSTAACSQAELKVQLTEGMKVLDCPAALQGRAAFYRSQNRRIVFTNGCFDIVHAGSIACLHRAREMGDVLFVGVNSDDSVQKIKGTGRPINTLEDRIKILRSIECIDHIVPFGERTACSIIQSVKPHVYVKGGDYSADSLPEVPSVIACGGEVVILPLLNSSSTSKIIRKIRQMQDLSSSLPLQTGDASERSIHEIN